MGGGKGDVMGVCVTWEDVQNDHCLFIHHPPPPTHTPPPHPQQYNYCNQTTAHTVDGKLDYDQLFEAKIQAKRNDNTYRYFRVMARSAGQFPHAKHYPDPSVPMEAGRDVTVWCSNDYLGMSKHPEVIKAAV